MVTSEGGSEFGRQAQKGHSQMPARLLILRASHASMSLGSSDTRVWPELDRGRFECVLLLQSKRGSSQLRRANVHTVISFVPRFPLFGWLLLNIVIVLRFARARFNLIVFSPRTWLAACVLRRLGVAGKLIMDVRSGPTHRWGILRTLEFAELNLALTFCRSDGLTFINERTKALVSSDLLGDIPVAIWGSGVDLDLFTPSRDDREVVRRRLGLEGAKVMMYHGSMTEDRGIFRLIRALEILREREAGVKLMLLGWGPDLGRIRSKFDHLVRGQALILKRPVPYEKVPAILGACDVGVLPFPRHAKWASQMPLKLLEYLAMGKMVAATDLEAHRGFGEGVFLLQDNDPETLASELDRIFQIPEAERAERLRDSLERVRRLSWKDQARTLQEFIERVLEESAGAPRETLRADS